MALTWVRCWLLASDQALTRHSTKLCLNRSGVTDYALFVFWAKARAAPLPGTGSGSVCPVGERAVASRDTLFLLLTAFGALGPLGIILMASACASMDRASTVSESSRLGAEKWLCVMVSSEGVSSNLLIGIGPSSSFRRSFFLDGRT